MVKVQIFSALFCLYYFSVVTSTHAQLNATFDTKIDERGLRMNWVEKRIKAIIENAREVLRKGDPALGIPVLDPYVRQSEIITANTSLVSASIDIKDLSVVGLSSYSVDDVRVSLSNLTASIRLSWIGIKAMGDYKLDGDINIPYAGNAPLYGNGTARGLIYKAWVAAKIVFSVENDEQLTASALHLSWDIINPQIRVDGLFGGHELGNTINSLIEDLIPKLDAAYHDQMQKVLQETVLKFINDYLSGVQGQGEARNLLRSLRDK